MSDQNQNNANEVNVSSMSKVISNKKTTMISINRGEKAHLMLTVSETKKLAQELQILLINE